MRSIRRRRLEMKTDYKARLALLKSRKPRVVVRKTNRYIIAQIVSSDVAQDSVTLGLSSKILLTKGLDKKYSGTLKSIPAAYLTGYLLGSLAKEKGINNAVLDIGMYRNIHKSRIFAVLKGIVDAGLNIPHNPECLPTDEMVSNEKYSSIIKEIVK